VTDETTTTTTETPAATGPTEERETTGARRARAIEFARERSKAGTEPEPESEPESAETEPTASGDGASTAEAETEGAEAPSQAPPSEEPVYDAEQGRWRAGGKFVAAPEDAEERIAALEAEAGGETETEPREVPEEGEPSEETEKTDEETAEPVVVRGPGREEGSDAEIDVSALPEEQRELVRMWANNGMRRADFHRKSQDVEEARQQFNEFQEVLKARPEILIDHMPEEKKTAVALALVADPAVFDAVAERVEEWQVDPTGRTKAENDRLRAQLKERGEAEERARLTRAYRQIENAVIQLIPEDAPDTDADAFYRDAIRDLEDAIRAEGVLVAPRDVPELVERRLSQYGFENGAAAPAEEKTSASARDPRKGERPKGEESPDPVKDRRTLVTTPGGGGAAGSTGFKVPKDLTLKDARSFVRKHFQRA